MINATVEHLLDPGSGTAVDIVISTDPCNSKASEPCLRIFFPRRYALGAFVLDPSLTTTSSSGEFGSGAPVDDDMTYFEGSSALGQGKGRWMVGRPRASELKVQLHNSRGDVDIGS